MAKNRVVKLFEPVWIGNVEVKNRIVMPAMHLGFCNNEYIDERIISFYRERARGGTGLIVVGGCNIDQHAYSNMVALRDDSFIPGHRSLVSAIKGAGARACAQLFQPGRYASSKVTGQEPVAPSPLASGLTREIPREMTSADIHQVIAGFVAAARRAAEAGYDLVEVIASAGYLISQFFSPVTNHRQDEYGGSIENRARFGEEVIRAIRRELGEHYPIMVRLSGNEFMTGGNTNQEVAWFARRLQEAGANAFNVTGGWHESRVPQITMNVPPGAYVYLAQGIKRAVSVPVIACNRINDAWLAEKILLEEQADLIGMARGLVADPEFPLKVKEGRFKEIRKCIGCNQGCLDEIFSGRSCQCLVNARAGREAEIEIKPVGANRKKVLVIGGGPAGMEAARIAASRGHIVSLWEKDAELGGQLLLAAAVPGRGDFYHLVAYLRDSLVSLGVDVFLNQRATIEEVRAFSPDAVLVATGARPVLPDIPGIKCQHVVGAWDVLRGEVVPGSKVVVLGGGAVGGEVALYIASMGTINGDTIKFLMTNKAESPEKIWELATRGMKEVVILEKGRAAGQGIGNSTRWILLQELRRLGVEVCTSTTALAIEADGVIVAGAEGQRVKIPADTVVVAAGCRADNSLYQELSREFSGVYLIGDAQAPRKAFDAIREGFMTGNIV